MSNVIIISLIIILIILDQISKNMAYSRLNKGQRIVFNKHLSFVLLRNRGAAYGLLKRKPKFLKAITIVIIAFLFINFIIFLGDDLLLPKIALGLFLAGGIGNFTDRIRRGYVVDFIYINFKKWPVFNMADAYILIGALIAIYSVIFQ